nr:succinate--CoA ligase subunit alpha [Myxococcota bacterium]
IFEGVREAVRETGADATCIFVPAPYCKDAILEAVDAGVRLIVGITEGMPVLDMLAVKPVVDRAGIRLIGPNCPGVISPGKCKIGILPASVHRPGTIGVVSRSGTLTYEAVAQLSELGLGQSTAVGIGGDPVAGTSFVEVLEAFEADPGTEGVVLIGEIGGQAEEKAAAFVRERMTKPVVAFIAGRTAPPGRRMGHAGAIVSGGSGTAEGKIQTLRDHGIEVAETPADIGATMARRLGR